MTKATSNIELKRFETSIRQYLELTVPRLMLVLEPLTVIIDDLPDDYLEMVDVPFSKDPAYGVRNLPFHFPKTATALPLTRPCKLISIANRHTPSPSQEKSTSSAATSAK